MSLMRLQQPPLNLASISPSLQEASHDDGDGNETSPTLTNNTPTAFEADTYTDEPSLEEADATLERFRHEMVPLCPYVCIPREWDAATLRQQYPFLWLNVMGVASLSTKTRYSLGRQAKNIIVQKVVADGTRSVDMLLGVLTFLCWIHLLPMDKLFGSMASQIAVSLIHDLGLHMTPPEYPSKVGQLLNGKGFGLLPQIRKERTMEDRRALIGAYIITSMTCHAFRSADGLGWSTYLDECLNYVSQNSTEPHDHILITQAKLQLMINRLRSVYRGGSNVQVPTIYSNALRSELDSLLTSTDGVSNIFDNNSSMKRLYHFSMLMVHESHLNKSSMSHDKGMQKFEDYQLVINSLRSWLDLYFAIPNDHLRFLPSSNYSQLYYVTVFIYRITALKIPTWNSLLAEAGAELVPVLDTVIQRFEQAALSMPDSQSDQAFLLGIHKFSALKAVFNSEFGFGIDGDKDMSVMPQDTFMGVAHADFSPFLMDPGMFPMMQGIFDDLAWQ
ncbi:unnamed protein product [Clonostachys rosea]|uniref:Transcription factor domain-containing protein n=1 Tax=Bionectria ochroleuca TaxID=29856 RepID=A0ABY6U8N4_BIOOC|nr:unnamed protein product [Clonostachys rosea]